MFVVDDPSTGGVVVVVLLLDPDGVVEDEGAVVTVLPDATVVDGDPESVAVEVTEEAVPVTDVPVVLVVKPEAEVVVAEFAMVVALLEGSLEDDPGLEAADADVVEVAKPGLVDELPPLANVAVEDPETDEADGDVEAVLEACVKEAVEVLCRIGPTEFAVGDDTEDTDEVLLILVVDAPVYEVTIVVGVIELIIDVTCPVDVISVMGEDDTGVAVLVSVGSGSGVGFHHHGLEGPNPPQGGRPPENGGLPPPNLPGAHRLPPKRPRPPPKAPPGN